MDNNNDNNNNTSTNINNNNRHLINESINPNVVASLNSSQQRNRLAFYKPPQQKQNIYQFSKQDIERSQVVQQRFKQMSLSNDQVTEGGRAEQSVLKLGDTLVQINDQTTHNMSLDEANRQIQNTENKLNLAVKKLIESVLFVFYLSSGFWSVSLVCVDDIWVQVYRLMKRTKG